MRPSTIWFTLKQGIVNIKRNWMFSLASILTMAACIFLVGVFYSIVNNVDNIAHKVEQEVPITVFFNEGTTQEQIDQISAMISQRPEVEKVEFTSADQAWEDFKEEYFQGSDAAEGFRDDNPLVNSANLAVYRCRENLSPISRGWIRCVRWSSRRKPPIHWEALTVWYLMRPW